MTGSSNPPLKIVVPCNDTFSERNVKVEISSLMESDDDRILKNYVPLNHGTEYQNKAVYMNDRGQLIILNEFTDGDDSPLTMIGTPAKDDVSRFESMFSGNERQQLTLSLQ